MDVASLSSLYGTTPVVGSQTKPVNAGEGFDSIINSVMSLLKDTNATQQAASAEKIAYALGETDNTHDLMIAEQKANIALQYTVAIRDRVLESYNTIMNMAV